MIDARLTHEAKAALLMLVTLAGIETLDKMLHSQNAWFPILVTPFEIVIPPNLLQLTNAPLLILVTLEEIVTKVMLWQFWNALIPIVVTVKALIVAGMLTVPLSVLVYPVIVTWLLLPDQMRPAAVVPVMVFRAGDTTRIVGVFLVCSSQSFLNSNSDSPTFFGSKTSKIT